MLAQCHQSSIFGTLNCKNIWNEALHFSDGGLRFSHAAQTPPSRARRQREMEMASGGGKRKIGQNKRKPTNMAYKAEGRAGRNKKIVAARVKRIYADHAEKKLSVTIKRKRGAVARIERRIQNGVLGLSETLKKAKAALIAAESQP